jgi:hypothetical protein
MLLEKLEYYQLVCCTSKKPLEVNRQIIVFEFNGEYYNDNIPDKLIKKVLSNIENISKNKTTGCYELIDVTKTCDPVLYKIVQWKTFFVTLDIFDCCKDCLPEPKEVPHIVLNNLFIEKEPDPCYPIIKNFVKHYWRDAMERMEGISLCCPVDPMKSIVEYQILIRERTMDNRACCPPCVNVNLSFTANSVGVLSYVNCNNETITENINTLVPLTRTICVCVNSYNLLTFIGPSVSGFTQTPTGIPCIDQN